MNEEISIEQPTGIICQACSHLNALEVYYCEMCGSRLVSNERPQSVEPQKATSLNDETAPGIQPPRQQIRGLNANQSHQPLEKPQQNPTCPK